MRVEPVYGTTRRWSVGRRGVPCGTAQEEEWLWSESAILLYEESESANVFPNLLILQLYANEERSTFSSKEPDSILWRLALGAREQLCLTSVLIHNKYYTSTTVLSCIIYYYTSILRSNTIALFKAHNEARAAGFCVLNIFTCESVCVMKVLYAGSTEPSREHGRRVIETQTQALLDTYQALRLILTEGCRH